MTATRVTRTPTPSLRTGSVAGTALGAALGVAEIGVTGAVVVGLMNQFDDVLRTKSVFDSQQLHFPSNIGTDQTGRQYMSFWFDRFSRRSMFDAPFFKDAGVIRLPIPNQLAEQQDINYDQQNLGLAVGALIDGAAGVKNGGSIADKLKAGAVGAGVGAAARLVGGGLNVLGGDGKALVDAGASLNGLALNPFLTLLFRTAAFKVHQFQWRLAARNQQESQVLAAICNKFRYHALPDASGAAGGTVLTYPDRVLIKLMPNDSMLYQFKPCVISSIHIDYTPSGQPSFHTNDAPTEVSLTIRLIETELWLKSDLPTPGSSV